MNRITKHILGLTIIIAMFLIIKTPAQAVTTKDGIDMDDILRQTSCTESSVTVRWKSMQGIDKDDPSIRRDVDHYTLQLYAYVNKSMVEYDNPYSETFQENGSKTYTTTLKNLPTNYWGKVRINLTYDKYQKNGDEWDFVETITDQTVLFCNVWTKPLRPTDSQFGIPSNTTVKNLKLKSWIEVKDSKWFYKKEIELYKGNKPVAKKDLSFLNESELKLQKGVVYQYRARYYTESQITGYKICSDWSSWKGFVVPKDLSFASSPGKKGFKITLGKIAGVSRYTVYTSLKKKSGFKKAKNFKAKNKKSYSVQITKGYKKGKKNYIKMVPYINLKYYKGPSGFAIVTPRPLKISK